MNKIENVQKVLQKEMSRKEFLQHVGIFVVGAFGVTGLISHFLTLSDYQPEKKAMTNRTNGYGGRAYGS